MTLDTVTTFFGWCTAIHIAIYLFVLMAMTLFKGVTLRLNARVLGVDTDTMQRLFVHYLANYKLLITVFGLVPYVALKIMA